jgi:hypothetical protein
MATRRLYSANHYHRMEYADFGLRLLDKDGTASSPSGEYYCKLVVLKDAEITFSNNHTAGDQSFTSVEMKQGTVLNGAFHNVTMVNGVAMFYIM